MKKKHVSFGNHTMLFVNKSTGDCPNIQVYPGARTMYALLGLDCEHHIINADCHDGEVRLILFLSFGSVGPIPMVVVPILEYAPFWIAGEFGSNGSAVEAFIQCRLACFSCKFVYEPIGCECRIGKPIAYHDSCVAESKSVKTVNNLLRAYRHKVGVFDCYHNHCGIKLNIAGVDVSSISPVQFKPIEVILSLGLIDRTAENISESSPKMAVAKCQHISKSDDLNISEKCLANHVANHDEVFVIPATSIRYKPISTSANHVSNHDRLQMTQFWSHLTTYLTTIEVVLISVISVHYKDVKNPSNHVANHDRLKLCGSKMIVTTTSNHDEQCVNYPKYQIVTEVSFCQLTTMANHDRRRFLTLKKTLSSILYIILLYLYYRQRGIRAHTHTHVCMYAREPDEGLTKKSHQKEKINDL